MGQGRLGQWRSRVRMMLIAPGQRCLASVDPRRVLVLLVRSAIVSDLILKARAGGEVANVGSALRSDSVNCHEPRGLLPSTKASMSSSR